MPEAQAPAPQPQVTVGTKSHDWKKVSLTILIILVVAGLIVAAYWFLVLNKSSDNSDLLGPVPKVTTPKATESAKEATPSVDKAVYCETGKEHKFTEYGLKVCLPKDYTFSRYFPEKKWLVLENSQIPVASDVFGFLVIEFSDKTLKEELVWDKKKTETEITVDNVKAVKQIGTNCATGCLPSGEDELEQVRTVFEHKDQTYDIFLVGGGVEEITAYNQLISTFKFLD